MRSRLLPPPHDAQDVRRRQRLAAASNEELERLAHFARPRWRTITVTIATVGGASSDPRDASAVGSELELLESATLADARKLITTFCVEVPRAFEFATLVTRGQSADDEGRVRVSEVLEDGDQLLVVGLALSRKPVVQSVASTAAVRDNHTGLTSLAAPVPPTFTLVRQFGAVRATADVYAAKAEGMLTLQLHSFAIRRADSVERTAVDASQVLTVELDTRTLAARAAMTADTVLVLLSSSRGQVALLQKVLGQLELIVDNGQSDSLSIGWTWSTRSSEPTRALANDVQLRKVKRSPVVVRESETREKQLMVPVASLGQLSQRDGVTNHTRASAEKLPRRSSTPAMPRDETTELRSAPATLSTSHRDETLAESGAVVAKPREPTTPPLLSDKVPVESDALKTLKACLEIANRRFGSDIPVSFATQIVFDELILRTDTAPASLSTFVADTRTSLRDVLRSYSLAESVTVTAAVLSTGLQVTLWEAKVATFAAHFRSHALASIESLQQAFCKARFEGLETPRTEALPGSIMTLVSCLGILAGGGSGSESIIQDTVVRLGLDSHRQAKKRLEVFRALHESGKSSHSGDLVGKRDVIDVRVRLDALVTRLRDEPFTADDDARFHAKLLHAVALSLLNVVDFDLVRSVNQCLETGDSVAHVQSLLRTSLAAPDAVMTTTVRHERVVRLNDTFRAFVDGLETESRHSNRGHTTTPTVAPAKENLRWLHAETDCDAIAASSSDGQCRFRWFIPPSDVLETRYVFAGEADLMCEWVYMDASGAADTDDTDLLKRVLSVWSARGGPDSSAVVARTGFGVNFRHLDLLDDTATSTMSTVNQLLATYAATEAVAIGCHVGGDHGSPSVAIVRVYTGAVRPSTQSLTDFLERLQSSPAFLKCTLLYGGLPFVRMVALREVRRRQDMFSLQPPLARSGLLAARAVEVAIVTCAASPELLLASHVSHYILWLILENGVGAAVTSAFLSRLLKSIEEALDVDGSHHENWVADFVNQVFVFPSVDMSPPSQRTRAWDVYDVFWTISACERVDASCRAASRLVAVTTFFRDGVMNDDRILRYSDAMSPDAFRLGDQPSTRDTSRVVPATVRLDESQRAYFTKVVAICAPYIRDAHTTDTDRSRRIDALLLRLFSVLERPGGARALELSQPLVDTMRELLRTPTSTYCRPDVQALIVRCIHQISVDSLCDAVVRADALKTGLVAGLLEFVWELDQDDAAVGNSVIHALTNFQAVCSECRVVVAATLVRLLNEQVASGHDTIVSDILPWISDDNETTTFASFLKLVVHQHDSVEQCKCSAHQVLTEAARNAVVTRCARKVVTVAIQQALKASVARAAPATSGPDRLHSLAIKWRKAGKIQRSFLRWLYASKRGTGVLPAVDQWWVCPTCRRTPSFLAGVLVCLRETPASLLTAWSAAEAHAAIPHAAFIGGVVEFVRAASSDSVVRTVLVQRFRIEYTLLKLVAHDSGFVRRCAIRALAEFSWRCEACLAFACTRLLKPLWENRAFSPSWQKADKKFCSWIESALRSVLPRLKPASMSAALLSLRASVDDAQVSVAVSSPVLADAVLSDMDAVSSLLLVLSFEPENALSLLKIAPTVVKHLAKVRTVNWLAQSLRCSPTCETHVRTGCWCCADGLRSTPIHPPPAPPNAPERVVAGVPAVWYGQCRRQCDGLSPHSSSEPPDAFRGDSDSAGARRVLESVSTPEHTHPSASTPRDACG